MNPTDHPLTEARAAELWDASRDPGRPLADRHEEMHHDERATAVTALRAAFDAGREHERAQTRPTEITDEAAKAVGPGPRERITNDIGEWVEVEMREGGYSFLHMGCGHMMGLDTPDRAALSAALAVATPADPYHDPRPWRDCTREDIRAGDLVQVRRKDLLCTGVAHRQDEHGDWTTEDGYLLSNGYRWPLRRIPAPTQPAEEVELPTEFPVHITDVEADFGDVCAYMALSKYGTWFGVDQDGDNRHWGYMSIAAFTLPDGTRACRDGDHEDGTPRFVKEDA